MTPVTSTVLPQAFAGVPYSVQLPGTGPFQMSGNLPGSPWAADGANNAGLTLNPNTGVLCGTPPPSAELHGALILVTTLDLGPRTYSLDILPGTYTDIGGQLFLQPADGSPPRQIP